VSDRTTKIERQAYKWVLNMLDDPGKHAAALERWLSKDEEHRAVYKRVAIEVGRASDAAATSPSLRAGTHLAQESSGWWTRGRVVAVGGLVAVGLTVAGVFGVLNMSAGDSGPSIFSKPPEHKFAAGTTERIVRLQDASIVTLFPNSQIDTDFSKTERSVRLLNGKARFAVAHNAARPFVVYAAGGRVTATGTLFEVSIDRGVKVHLISGTIEVSFPPATQNVPAKVVRLGPGQEVSFPPSVAASPLPTPPASSTPSRQDTESFDDVPASEIVAKVNQTSTVKIAFADPATGARKVVADLDTKDPQAVADKLAMLLGLVVDRSTADRLVLRRSN